MNRHCCVTLFLAIFCFCLPLGHSLPVRRGILSALGLSGGSNQAGNVGNIILNSIKDTEESDAGANKPKPYDFNDVEMTAIQAMVSLRDIIGDLLHRVGLNIPSSLASLITRSEHGEKATSTALSSLSSASAGSGIESLGASKAINAAALLRGLAISLPLLIPMATQIRRMSTDSVAPQLPQFPMPYGPYYQEAAHRRRGKRSAQSKVLPSSLTPHQLEQAVRVLQYLREAETRFGQ